jgi:hypothetical protein
MRRRKSSAMKYKIALYGFGSLPVVYRHLIDLARSQDMPLEWCVILPQPDYRALMREVLPPAEILDLFESLPRIPQKGDLTRLKSYPGSLLEDLAAQKRTSRRRSGQWRLDRAIEIYSAYKAFLVARGASHILMSVIETPEAKIAVAVAKELGLGVIAPVDLRSLTGTYFSNDCCETPPDYAVADAETCARAREFVAQFRARPGPARSAPSDIDKKMDDQTILATHLPPFPSRLRAFVGNAIARPDLFDPELIRISIMRNFGVLRTAVRGLRKRYNNTQYDEADIERLPKRFVFYPLQYTPEASINTPAPYFVDQLRAIDALRYAMPSDCMLVVKEHPVCLEMRPISFMRRIRRLPGVVVVKGDIPAIELMKRAALTATVTGTAAFEAFLLGLPALALGPGISAWVLGGWAELGTLREKILHVMAHRPADDLVIERIAKLISVRYPFVFDTPHLPGEPVLRTGNLRRFLSALQDHCERERHARLIESSPVRRATTS